MTTPNEKKKNANAAARRVAALVNHVTSSGPQRRLSIASVLPVDEGAALEVNFGDGSAYRFHSLWLRDACRDEAYVANKAGERILGQTPIVLGTDLNLRVIKADIAPGNTKVKIQWSTHESGEFDATLLRAYAKTSALRTAGDDEHASDESLGCVHLWEYQMVSLLLQNPLICGQGRVVSHLKSFCTRMSW